ncbi:MAG TPA: helix-turn-helix transcriptional regulator, partial [Microlunatus sp.]|nr:helix-turn-helix transcriptional regulator [Microlunatus sp.]
RAADRLLAAAQHTADTDDRNHCLTQAIDLLLNAGEVGEATGYAAQLAQLPPTPERLLVQAKLAWLSGQPSAEELARHVWIQCGTSAPGGAAAALVAQARVLADDGPGAAKWATRALECPNLPSDAAIAARMNLATGLIISGRPEDALAFVSDVPETSDLAHSRPQVWLRGGIRLWMDNLVGAHEDLRARPGESLAEAVSPQGLMRLGFLSQVEYRLGRWAEALHHAEQTVSLVRDTDQTWLLGFAHAMAVYVFAGRGLWTQADDHVQAAEAAAERLGDQGSKNFAANAAIHLACARGDHDTVITRAQALQSRPSIGVHDPAAFDWRRRYVAALVASNRHEEADHHLSRLVADCQRRKLPLVLSEVFGIYADLATTQRQPELARQRYEQALGLDPDGVAPFVRARLHASYGRLLRRSGERRAATEHLLHAQKIFVQLDATPDLDHCIAELAAVGVAVDEPKLQLDARLTPQERAVARLVCAGRTNREVASELVLSVKTVSYHLQNVYTKLGIKSRTQLAASLGSTVL